MDKLLEYCKDDLRKILDKIIPDNRGEITDETDLFQIGLDSLRVTEFVLHIEDEFGIEVDLEDIRYEAFKTINSISALIHSKLNTS